jgi:large subunit ribosomal protein L24
MQKIKKGDEVIVTTGKSKGHRGVVTRILAADRVLVENANMVKRHVRPNPQRNEPGGIKELEAPIHISNVAIYNPVTKRADRVGFRTLENGSRVRVFKSNGEPVEI